MSLIDIKDLRFSWPASGPVLDIRAWSVSAGERVFLRGPSGSGKTTLLEILAGVLCPQEGEVRLLGENIAAMSEPKRDRFRARHIGYIFQNFNLIPWLNVTENILLPMSLRGERGQGERRLEQLVQALDIAELLKRPVARLSIGQQQRVAVARALIGRPEIILADEPTSALDEDRRKSFLQLLFQQIEDTGSTLIFVSHDKSIENLFTQRIGISDINSVVLASGDASYVG